MAVNNILRVFSNVTYRVLIILLLFAVAGVVSPWLALIALGIFARGVVSESIGQPALAVTLVSFLAFFNATKRLDGDWYWYVTDYITMLRMNLWDYLQMGGSSIRITEPCYYAFSFVLSRLTGGNVGVLALAVSLAVYLTYVFALEKLMKLYGFHRWAAVICVVFAVLAGLTFTQSLHLIRQYLAGSVLFLYFVLLLEGKSKAVLVLFILGCLIHNSFGVPAVILVLCAFLWKWSWVQRRYLWVIILLMILGYGIGLYLTTAIHVSSFDLVSTKDEGDISVFVLLQDGLLFFVSLVGIISFKDRHGFCTKGSAIAVLFMAFWGSLLLGIHDLSLWFLRLYFYVEWFRVIGVVTIVWFTVYRVKQVIFAIPIIPVSFLVMGMRVAQSPFNYGGGFYEHFFQSAIWWVDNISMVIQ
jgi:hypothetical protein